jgi:hypothetical protein
MIEDELGSIGGKIDSILLGAETSMSVDHSNVYTPKRDAIITMCVSPLI